MGPDLDIPIVLQTEWEKKWADNTHFCNNIFYADGTAQYSSIVERNENGTFKKTSGFGLSTNNVFSNNVFYGNHVNPPKNSP
jgi:hypothetical protein